MPKSKVRAKRRKALKGWSSRGVGDAYMSATGYGRASEFINGSPVRLVFVRESEFKRVVETYKRGVFIVGSELGSFGASLVEVVADVDGVSRDIVGGIPVEAIVHEVVGGLFSGSRSQGAAHKPFVQFFFDGVRLTCGGIIDYLRDGRVSADMLVRVRHVVDLVDSLGVEAAEAWGRTLGRCVEDERSAAW